MSSPEPLPPHVWLQPCDCCTFCGVPMYAVEDGIIGGGCGTRADVERQVAREMIANALSEVGGCST